MRLNGSVVVITGGASGLGEAVARRAIAEGATGVALLDVNDQRAADLAGELGPKVLPVHCDVRSGDEVTEAIAAVHTNGSDESTLLWPAPVSAGPSELLRRTTHPRISRPTGGLSRSI